jgi:hypothetical protein
MPVFCLFTLGRHGNFTAGVTWNSRFVVYRTCAKYRVIKYYRVCRFIDVILVTDLSPSQLYVIYIVSNVFSTNHLSVGIYIKI